MASAVSGLSSSGSTTSSAAGPSPSAPTEQMFLQLLVSQIKNQDPLNPTDSTQFVSQLAQFSQLEQVIGIRNDIEKGAAAAASAAPGQAAAPAPVPDPAQSSTDRKSVV